jgi:2-oxoglutarate ferredoxin oxidoreductase subunit gamma
MVKPGGLLVVNSSLIEHQSSRTDIDVIYVPANAIAEEWGTGKMMNMAAIGAMLAARPVLTLAAVEQALVDHLPASKQHLIEANNQVIRHGYRVGEPAHV